MILRREQTALKLAFVVAIAGVAVTLSTTAAAATSAQPPAALFRPGYNLCHAASLAAIRQAGGQHYLPGVFGHASCTWQRSDLEAGIILSTHPTAVGRALMRMFKSQSGKNHITARAIKVPLARKALLVTFPTGDPARFSKYLFAAYRRGVIQVNMTAPNSLPVRRLRAVLAVVSHTG